MTDAQFESLVLRSKTPTLVEFWAPWCGPCKAIAPLVDAVAHDYAGKIDVRKMNTETDPQTAARFGVRAIPTLLLFKDGRVVDQVVGAVRRTKIEEMINRLGA